MAHPRKVMLSFFITSKCNLRCRYCYTKKEEHKNQTLPWDFAKLGIEKFLGEGFTPHIRFFGAGEPTTEIALLQRIVEYSRKTVQPKPLTVELQTNGVFSESVAAYLADACSIIWVSCDGLPETQDYYRPTREGLPSSPIIERNVRFLTEKKECMTGIRATITNETVTTQSDLLRYFADLGVRHVWSDPIFPGIGEPMGSANIDLMQYAQEFIKAQDTATALGITYGSILTCNFDEPVRIHCRACLPAPHLTTDGFVSACDMALFGNDTNSMSVFIYGKWDREHAAILIDEEKLARLQCRTIENLSGCASCAIRERCGGFCLGEVTNETGDMFGRKPEVCRAIRYLAERIPPGSVHYQYLHP